MADFPTRGSRVAAGDLGDCEVVQTVATDHGVDVVLRCGAKDSAAPAAHDNLHSSPLSNGQAEREVGAVDAGELDAEDEGIVADTPAIADRKAAEDAEDEADENEADDEADNGPAFGEAELR